MTTNTDSIPVIRAFPFFGTRVRKQRPEPTPTQLNLDAIRDQEQRERDWERNLRLISMVGMR
jgi:hypothetical protein